ncbi:MAG: hypothetical protein ACC634_05250, partial [Hyphomicrobiales bacterium]
QWFVTDWGVMTVGHFRDRQQRVGPEECTTFKFRLVVRDVEVPTIDLSGIYLAYVKGEPQ